MGFIKYLKGFSDEESLYIDNIIQNFTEDEKEMFLSKYHVKRKTPLTYILLALLGFIGFGGIHRFYIEDIGMGLLEFFTIGGFLVGTLVDIINYKKNITRANFRIAEVQAFETKNYLYDLNNYNPAIREKQSTDTKKITD